MLIDQNQPVSNKVTAYFYTTRGAAYALELSPNEGVYERDHDYGDHFIRAYSVKVNVGQDESGKQLPPLDLYIQDNLKNTPYFRFRLTAHWKKLIDQT